MDDYREGRLLDRRAFVLVAAAIGLGGVMQLIALALAHSHSAQPEAVIRYDIVLTLGFYAVVGVLLVSQITPSVRLRWGHGSLALRLGVGAGCGVGISLLLLALVSAAAGHLQSDPRIVLMMSEGDPTHIVVTAFIGCVAAPLVEETLFRGLLLESLRPRGTSVAILVSAGAFAVWHFMPASLVYYAVLGAALGGIYLRRGLAGSIAAHVGFNAVLTIAAIAIVLGPSHQVTVDGLTVTAPSGWSLDTAAATPYPGVGAELQGPDDAQFQIVTRPVPFDPSVTAQRLTAGALRLSGVAVNAGAVTLVASPVGQVVEAPIQVLNQYGGTLAMFGVGSRTYIVVFLDAGSSKADQDFRAMISSIHAA